VTLSEKQATFTACLARLILWADDQPNVRVRLREVGRYPWVAATMAFFGRGVEKSTHTAFCAADLVLDRLEDDGTWVYQKSSEDYDFLGERWKAMHHLARWGGDFSGRKDGNHFSFEHGGIK